MENIEQNIEATQDDQQRVSWRLIIKPGLNVSMGKKDQSGSDINLHLSTDIQVIKEISRWKKVTSQVNGNTLEYWHRTHRKEVSMQFDNINGVSVGDNLIHFEGNGSHLLLIHDQGLIQDTQDWGITIDEVSLANAVIQPRGFPHNQLELYGKNVQVEAELDVYANERINPVLFLWQPGGEYVCLSVNTENNLHRTKWEISGQCYETYPYQLTGGYLLTVSQDRDRKPGVEEPTYFEFFTDSIPLKVEFQEAEEELSGFTKRKHAFSNGPMEWYVGYNPETKVFLQGAIGRLVFDPNASCPECN